MTFKAIHVDHPYHSGSEHAIKPMMNTRDNNRETVILVHGIWMTGLEMGWLGRRLAGQRFDLHYFRYRSLHMSPAENASKLKQMIIDMGLTRLHLVGHSLGGIVLMHLFDQYPDIPQGRVVLLGSPVLGSGVARVMARKTWYRPFLGSSIHKGLLGDAPMWRGDRDLGVIAGTRGMGMGRVVGGIDGVSDGTVAVAETRLAGATDFCTLKVSHTGMLFSAKVADETGFFLRHGQFQDHYEE